MFVIKKTSDIGRRPITYVTGVVMLVMGLLASDPISFVMRQAEARPLLRLIALFSDVS